MEIDSDFSPIFRMSICTAHSDSINLFNVITDMYVQVYRHGDRAPVAVFPNDRYQADSWPDGLGMLTHVSHIISGSKYIILMLMYFFLTILD